MVDGISRAGGLEPKTPWQMACELRKVAGEGRYPDTLRSPSQRIELNLQPKKASPFWFNG